MKKIYITLTRRVAQEADSPEDKSEFVIIDWETKQVSAAYIADSGEKVRTGRSRGLGGITWHNDKIYIACRLGVFVLDPNTYEEIKKIAIGEPLGIHQIKSDGKVIWVAAMNADCLQIIQADKVKAVVPTTEYGTIPRGDALNYNGLNAIGFSPAGEMFLLYSHKGQIYNWTTQKVVVTGLDQAPHDICFISEDECLFTQSSSKELFKANVRTGAKTLLLSMQNLARADDFSHAASGWLRGISYYRPTNSVFLTAAPGVLLEVDTLSWKIREQCIFSERVGDAPFDILLDPRDWKNI